jgi:hypothetical protein
MRFYVKAHWLDVEIASVAICSMTGPKPSEHVRIPVPPIITAGSLFFNANSGSSTCTSQYLAQVQAALRDDRNWRWMQLERNMKEIGCLHSLVNFPSCAQNVQALTANLY